ncbi:glycosyltransferase, partial [Actinomycetota bacterium]
NFIINNILYKNTANYSLPKSFKKTQPLISILVPARNEAANIKRCIRSLLKQDYPNIEIIVLNDNSEDDTALIVERLAAENSNLKLINGKPLKPGWLGKCYACYQLSKHAKGEYFVFTDADTFHVKSSVSSAIGCLVSNKLDVLSAIPRQIMVGIHERMVVSWTHFGILSLLPLIMVKKSKNPLFATANGQFLLFKRKVYEKIGGHKSIKAKVLEDIHMAKQVKRCGYRIMLFDGSTNIACRMYRNFKDLLRGFSKFMYAAFDFKLFTMTFVVLFIISVFLAPFILLPLGLLVFDWSGTLIGLFIIQIFAVLVMRSILAIRVKSRAIDVLLHPLSTAYILLICINSVLQTKFGEGVNWKDRRYDVSSGDFLELIDDEEVDELSKSH